MLGLLYPSIWLLLTSLRQRHNRIEHVYRNNPYMAHVTESFRIRDKMKPIPSNSESERIFLYCCTFRVIQGKLRLNSWNRFLNMQTLIVIKAWSTEVEHWHSEYRSGEEKGLFLFCRHVNTQAVDFYFSRLSLLTLMRISPICHFTMTTVLIYSHTNSWRQFQVVSSRVKSSQFRTRRAWHYIIVFQIGIEVLRSLRHSLKYCFLKIITKASKYQFETNINVRCIEMHCLFGLRINRHRHNCS